MAGIDALQCEDRFVRALPGNPARDNRPRQVYRAAYTPTDPTPVPAPQLLARVPEVAALLGLDPTPTRALIDVLAGNRVVPGMVPYAAVTAAISSGRGPGSSAMAARSRSAKWSAAMARGSKRRRSCSSRAPARRRTRGRADGRAVLRSSLRELVCSEAMHRLGIPTTRALSLVTTGAPVLRDLLFDGHPAEEPGAIVCRVAPSFLRFGSYEIHTARDDHDTLRRLVRVAFERWTRVTSRASASTSRGGSPRSPRARRGCVAEWLRVGFVHGVMNTDNMSILGLTIDYGPYGWLEPFDPDWTPNITDAQGRRYRFGNQAAVAHWNVAQLARALVPIADPEAVAAMQRTLKDPRELAAHHRNTSLRKLGLTARAPGDDDALLAGLADVLGARGVEVDMTVFFRALAEPLAGVAPLARARTTASRRSRIASRSTRRS